jgi:predicted nucleotidyltransferase
MVRIDEDRIKGAVVSTLMDMKEIAGVYLFGSALGLCRPDSDIDIGLVIKPLYGKPDKYYLDIALAAETRLDPIDGHPFQVVPLNITDCIFAFNVIRKGRLIYESDHEAVTDFMEIISRRYGENYPRYIKYLKEIAGA